MIIVYDFIELNTEYSSSMMIYKTGGVVIACRSMLGVCVFCVSSITGGFERPRAPCSPWSEGTVSD